MIGSGMEVAILRIWMWKHALEGCILGSDKCEECTIGEIPHTVVHWAIKYYECGNISSKIRNLNTHKSAQDDRQMRGMHYWGNPQRWALRLLIASKDRRGSKAYHRIIWHGIPQWGFLISLENYYLTIDHDNEHWLPPPLHMDMMDI